MSSKVFRPDGVLRAESPMWRQAGVAPPLPAEDEIPIYADPGEMERLRAQLAQCESRLPAAVDQARQEALRGAESNAARVAGELRDELTRRLAANVAELHGVRKQMRLQMEEDLVRLAVVVARRVVRRELTVDPEALLGIARAAIEQMDAREVHQLRVAPAESGLMKKMMGELGLPAKINVIADAGLECGSLVFETARGTVDASVDVQLAEIDRGLADVLKRSS